MEKLKSYCSRIASDLENIRKAVEDIVSYLRDSYGPLADDTLFEIKVILNELIINAVKHGNNGDPDKFITIEVLINNTGFAEFVLEDEGEGYDYSNQESLSFDNDLDLSRLNETGRGMIIVASLCDSIKICGCGNRIVFTKRLKKE